MGGISPEALTWSLSQLKQWAESDKPGKRVKQVVYRLLLLRQLGVTQSVSKDISTSNFSEHCRRFLLVSEGELSERTGGIEHYFVPTTCEYQKARGPSGSSTDWAIGTMWTRCQTWKENGVLDFTSLAGTQGSRSIRFTNDYVEILRDHLASTLLPALPLAIFLFREPTTSGPEFSSISTPEQLLEAFKDVFHIDDQSVEELFDWDISGFTGTLVAADELGRDKALELVLAEHPFGSSDGEAVEGGDSDIMEEGIYAIPPEKRKGIADLPIQLLVHGCPGSGKSYLLKEWANEVSAVITTVFHPETSYADFVGVYRPCPIFGAEEQEFLDEAGRERKHGEPFVTYEFVPGPLVDAYCFAKNNPEESVALIVEELSRANAALVFGDMLQLLDRYESASDGDLCGQSAYEINPKPEVLAYLLRHGVQTPGRKKIRFPKNLHIWATMNRSDQNARQLDAAFLRRWDKKYLSYTIPCAYGETPVDVPGGKLSWDELRSRINAQLLTYAPEDKFIGPYFLNKERLSSRESVAEDLLGYLWNDVLKARARDFFLTETFAQARDVWVTGDDNPFKSVEFQ